MKTRVVTYTTRPLRIYMTTKIFALLYRTDRREVYSRLVDH